MRFWDSSALVAIVVNERTSGRIRQISNEDQERAVWVLSEVEVLSGLWRRSRARELTDGARESALRDIDVILGNATVIDDVPAVTERARRVLALHPLRVADALQLAAALVACDDKPAQLPFVTLDDRLAEAARHEGFQVLP